MTKQERQHLATELPEVERRYMEARRRQDVEGNDATRGELVAADMHMPALEARADGVLVLRLR